ncbi:hypothetical protein LTS18_005941, partial [Coniosporium uncinatum]
MTAYGASIVVLGGEPSSAPHDPKELSLAYILDTSKIRYPPNEASQPSTLQGGPGRKYSAGAGSAPPSRGNIAGPPAQQARVMSPDSAQNALVQGSRLPRAAPGQAPSGPPPQQQPPQPRPNGVQVQEPTGRRPTDKAGMSPNGTRTGPYAQQSQSQSRTTSRKGSREGSRETTPTLRNESPTPDGPQSRSIKRSKSPPPQGSRTGSRGHSRTGSRSGSQSRVVRQQSSVSTVDETPGQSDDGQGSREVQPIDSGIGSSPALTQQNDELLKELEAVRSKNAWYASELAFARKAGYQPNAANSPVFDERAAEAFGDDDRPLVEALFKMRAELVRVQSAIDSQAATTANKLADIEKQRNAAVSEAAYAKAKLAAHVGDDSQAGTPGQDSSREFNSPDHGNRVNEMSRRLAVALQAQNELSSKADKLVSDLEAERRARFLAEDTADAAEKRATELDTYKQRIASEVESLRAELHEAQRIAREESANKAEAMSTSRLLEIDHKELTSKHSRLMDDSQNHATILQSLHEAVTASTDKASLLERKLEEERTGRADLEQKLTKLQSEHDERAAHLETTTRRLRDAEELAEKHAAEATSHRQAVLAGFGSSSNSRSITDNDTSALDERIVVLQQQVDAANAMARTNQEAADTAANKLRRAEERIAGLEAYQEQTSRESLGIRKQLQAAVREVQAHTQEKGELQRAMEQHKLEATATEVQLKTLKDLLEERGIPTSAGGDRRSRVLDSPGFSGATRFGTPELNRVRELERQLDESQRAHEEVRKEFEMREEGMNREWEEKLMALESDQQAAVKYVRGIEKMLAKMKTELQKTRGRNEDLERQLHAAGGADGAAARGLGGNNSVGVGEGAWRQERETLKQEIADLQSNVEISVTNLEGQINTLKQSLHEAQHEREELHSESRQLQQQHAQQMDALSDRSRAELEHLRLENAMLAERTRDAESKVQLFLDQFESSVDSYRRQSRLEPDDDGMSMLNGRHPGHPDHAGGGGHGHGHSRVKSLGGDSVYSEAPTETDTSELNDDDDEDDDTTTGD